MSNYNPKQPNIPYGYCHCGCGHKAPIRKKSVTAIGARRGDPYRYRKGHNSRITSRHPTWDEPRGCYRVPVGESHYALVDKGDLELVKGHTWSMSSGYAISKTHAQSTALRMHRVIACPPEGLIVDHINGDRMDNRRGNLRICTQEENARNRKIDKRNTSGYAGVSPAHKKWRADIHYDGEFIQLGRFDDVRHAAMVRDMAALELYGEFARVNLNVVGYKIGDEQ